MKRDLLTVDPGRPTLEAVTLIEGKGSGSLPVVKDGHQIKSRNKILWILRVSYSRRS